MRCGVGSLPHRDTGAAVEFVRNTTDVAYLPQLPNRHLEESMLVQWGDGIAGIGPDGPNLAVGVAPGDRAEAFGGAAALLNGFAGSMLKTQATGPVTLAAAMRAGGHRAPNLVASVAEALALRISDHLRWIRRMADVERVVVVIDEPALVALGGSGQQLPLAAQQAYRSLIESIDAEVGLHCCGDTDWGGVAAMGFDWLSWDLGALGDGFRSGLDELAAALGAGTRVMWGIVPTTPGPLPATNVLVGRYGTAIANLIVAGAPFESLRSQAWFTPACGLAGLTVSDAEAVTQRLEDVVGEVESGW